MGVIGVAIDKTQDAAKYLAKKGADLLEAERRAVDRAANEMRSTFLRAASGEILKRRTAAYSTSIGRGPIERGAGGSFEVRVGVRDGNARAYAAVHEGDASGGPITIRPKNGEWLMIPAAANKTSTGVARKTSPRDFPDGFFIRKGPDLLLFATPRGSGKGIDVQFFGKHQVTIPARAPMRKSFEAIRPRVPSIVQEEVARAVASA